MGSGGYYGPKVYPRGNTRGVPNTPLGLPPSEGGILGLRGGGKKGDSVSSPIIKDYHPRRGVVFLSEGGSRLSNW